MTGPGSSCDERIYAGPSPSVGIVIGTFAATPYIHLQLEMRRRHYGSVPLLVNDDGSPAGDRLRGLCRDYGADFDSNPRRLRRQVGDLSAFCHGFAWAEQLELEILVKLSRRFITCHNWIPALQALAFESQMPTFSQCCDHFNFGFRTECIAVHCRSWRNSGAVERIRGHVERDEPVFVEGFVHQLARDTAAVGCARARQYVRLYPRLPDRDGYAPWPIMADRRVTRLPDVLWHDCDCPIDYYRIARLCGLNYGIEDFEDPNHGCGLGPE